MIQWVALPPLDPLRIGEHVHGHVGWLAAIALVHPAVLLRHAQRRAHLSVGLGVGVVTLAGAMGVALYPAYRDTLRQRMFAQYGSVGYLFERKEHLAFGAILFAWAGAISYAAAPFAEPSVRVALRKTAHHAFVVAAVLALVTAVLGTVVASYATF